MNIKSVTSKTAKTGGLPCSIISSSCSSVVEIPAGKEEIYIHLTNLKKFATKIFLTNF